MCFSPWLLSRGMSRDASWAGDCGLDQYERHLVGRPLRLRLARELVYEMIVTILHDAGAICRRLMHQGIFFELNQAALPATGRPISKTISFEILPSRISKM